MACSCKAKKNTVFINTSNSAATREIPIVKVQQEIKKSKQSILQIVSDSTSYDFSSNTQPTDLCYNCIRKHLSIAYTLLQEDDPDTFLMAMGEILCASLHLTTANRNLHDMMQNRVLQIMRGNKDHIIYDLLNWIQNIQSIKVQAERPQPTPEEANLLGLMMAYGLLFVEVSYEQPNENWATAELFKGAIAKFSKDHNIDQFQNVRRIWKLIQSMQLYDSTYWDAKKELKQQLQKQWETYKASLTHFP